MFCAKCGSKIEEGARFCAGCGTPVKAANTPQEAQAAFSPTLTRSVTNDDVRTGNHERPDIGALSMEEIARKHKPVTPSPPPTTTQPMSLPRDKLLIALIVLSVVTIALAGLVVLRPSFFYTWKPNLNNIYFFFVSLTNWSFEILVAIALVQGFMYYLRVLKISAFIALLSGVLDFFRLYARIDPIKNVWQLIFSVIFLVSAIQLFKKNAGSVK